MSDLANARAEIDRIDAEILQLFARRMAAGKTIGKVKAAKNLPICNPEREREILLNIAESAGAELSHSARILFSTLFELSKSLQRRELVKNSAFAELLDESRQATLEVFPKIAKVACCGVPGAYAQLAADKIFELPDLTYFNDFAAVFSAVEKNLCQYGILPIENSTSGTIDQVCDLMLDHKFYIVRSYRLKIRHCLLAKPGTRLADVKEIISHEQGLKQCNTFIAGLKNIKRSTASSTAMAAKTVAESDRHDFAAIASPECAAIYGLEVLQEQIQNRDTNYTRFICISRKIEIYPGADKISIMGTLPHRPGALYSLLARFAVLGVNLTKLESRPRKGEEFEYMFYFDFEASLADPEVRALLCELVAEGGKFTFLGNYSER